MVQVIVLLVIYFIKKRMSAIEQFDFIEIGSFYLE